MTFAPDLYDGGESPENRGVRIFLMGALVLAVAGCLPDTGDFGGTDGGAADLGGSDAGVADGGTDSDAAMDASAPGDMGGPSDMGVDACVPDCTIGGACGADDGCGGRCLGVCPDPDNEVCYGGVCSTASWCVSSACDVFSGTGCSVGDNCHPTYEDEPDLVETRCAAPGAGAEGEPCTTPDDCDLGLGCRLGKCRRYCCHAGQLFTESSDHCRGYCERVGARTGFCVATCNTRDPDSCPADQVCVLSGERAGLMYCIETVAPDVEAGEPCEFANACGHGLFCYDGACRTTCDPSMPTRCGTAETCTTVFPTPGVSVCLP